MKENHIYAGSPAKDITDKVGCQFNPTSIEEKYKKMISYLKETNLKNIKIVTNTSDFVFDNEISYFDVDTRTYTKKRTGDEFNFMSFLLPDKAKFTPHEF